MTTLKIDHFDTQYAYCTDREKKLLQLRWRNCRTKQKKATYC